MRERIFAMSLERQILLGATTIALVVALIFAIYLLLFRVQYDVLFSDLRPADAAAIVEELEKRDVPFKLANGEKTILVPMDQLGQTKIAIAGSDMPIRGAVGFELFNESNIGLTEFAQKINYQRAIQGELARTVMAMEEIESARVHLAIPDRAIFRSEKNVPKAAVTLRARVGRKLDSESVDGIQKLVASAVNGLELENVSILDERGRLISQSSTADDFVSPDIAEKQAAEQYYRARIANVLENVAPGQNIRVEVRTASLASDAVDNEPVNESAPADVTEEKNGRNFRIAVNLISANTLLDENKKLIEDAVKGAIAFDVSLGDQITFSKVAAITKNRPEQIAEYEKSEAGASVGSGSVSHNGSSQEGYLYWLSIIGIALLFIIGLLYFLRRRESGLSNEELDSFAANIGRQFASADGDV